MRVRGFCLIILLVGGLSVKLQAAQLNRLRYNAEPDYTRVVLDLDGPVASYKLIPEKGNRFTLKLNGCRLNPALPPFTITSDLVKEVQFESPTEDTLLMHLSFKAAANVRVFTMQHPDRVVIDLRSTIPSGKPSVAPDPNQVVPLQPSVDPLLEFAARLEKERIASQPEEAETPPPEPSGESGTTERPATKAETVESTAPSETASTEAGSTASASLSVAQSTGANALEENRPAPPSGQEETSQTPSAPPENTADADTGDAERPDVTTPSSRGSATLSEKGWRLTNPWILAQLSLDLLLIGMIGILLRHAQKLNVLLRFQRAKLTSIEQNLAQMHSQPSAKVDQEGNQQKEEVNVPSQRSVPDFEQLLRQTEEESRTEIRSASAHNRAVVQSRGKQKRQKRSAPQGIASPPPEETAPMQPPRVQPPLEEPSERASLLTTAEENASVRLKMDETGSEDLSFDELREALSRLNAQLESLMHVEVPPSSEKEAPGRTKKPPVTGRRASLQNRSSSRKDPSRHASSWHHQVTQLADQGMDSLEISRRLGIPRGEVELILSLREQ